jgi:hypothetical protein
MMPPPINSIRLVRNGSGRGPDAFGLELTADGRETETAAHQLVTAGYLRAQGLLVSGPLDGAGMEAL